MGFFSRILGKKKEEELAGEPLEAAALERPASEDPSRGVSPAGGEPEGFAHGEEEPSPLSAPGNEAAEADAPVPASALDKEQTDDAAGAAQVPAEADASGMAAQPSIDRDEFILELRKADPTPGGWLKTVLEGIDRADLIFWQRLALLLESLNIPAGDSEKFISELKAWLAEMGYAKTEEFASELQYRLAIALGMEDSAEEKKRFLAKLWEGLARTREFISSGLRDLFSGTGELDNAFWESLEEVLILSDVGYEASLDLVERVRGSVRKNGAKTRAEAKEILQAELESALSFPPRVQAANLPEIVLMVGVNGAGKTTTIAKLAYREHLAGKKVLIAAGDTFRAAAVEQLEVWARRVGAGFYAKEAAGSTPADPAAVAFEAVGKALSENYDIVFIDTAGRLQTKTGLMEELGKIVRVLGKRHPGAPHRTILVLDATTGQNALSQAKLFSETSPVSEIIISKLDGTAKAGVAVGLAMQRKIPITFIGLGEKMEDLRPFDGQAFARALLE